MRVAFQRSPAATSSAQALSHHHLRGPLPCKRCSRRHLEAHPPVLPADEGLCSRQTSLEALKAQPLARRYIDVAESVSSCLQCLLGGTELSESSSESIIVAIGTRKRA